MQQENIEEMVTEDFNDILGRLEDKYEILPWANIKRKPGQICKLDLDKYEIVT